MKFPVPFILLLIVPSAGCLVASTDSSYESKVDRCEYGLTREQIEGSEMVNATGTVRWLDLEGALWGIETDDGKKFQPSDVFCEDLQEDGLRVGFEGRTRPDMASIFQWGTIIDLTLIERA